MSGVRGTVAKPSFIPVMVSPLCLSAFPHSSRLAQRDCRLLVTVGYGPLRYRQALPAVATAVGTGLCCRR